MTKELKAIRKVLVYARDEAEGVDERIMYKQALATLDSIMAVPDGYVMVPINEYTQLKNIQNAFQGVINMAAAPKHGGE